MDLIQNSKDLLFVVISISVLGLSVFLAWFIYYMVMLMRQFYRIVKDMRERLHKVDQAIDAFKEKIERSASYLSLIGDGVKKLVDVAREHGGGAAKGKKRAKKSSQNKK